MPADFPIDLVVTYVDDADPVWRAAVSKYNTEISPKRYRSWDTLKFWFRCVERNMPFIRTVYLVVSNAEQVPDWVNRGKVGVVLHRDIIPERLLPTFNSTTIEMFLYRIQGLAEHFIYSNDDMFAVGETSAGDFFENGIPIYELIRKTASRSSFRMQCRKSYNLAAKLAGRAAAGAQYFYIKHSMDPMLKSVCEEVHAKAGGIIMKSCTKFREPFNFTQYLFPDYGLMTGRGKLGKYSFKYVTMENPRFAASFLDGARAKIACLNDSGSVGRFDAAKRLLHEKFEKIFPGKSKFEHETSG